MTYISRMESDDDSTDLYGDLLDNTEDSIKTDSCNGEALFATNDEDTILVEVKSKKDHTTLESNRSNGKINDGIEVENFASIVASDLINKCRGPQKLYDGQTDLLDENKRLKEEITRLKSEVKDLKTQNKNLKKNISKLYNTAISENARKDMLIQELREQLDNILFRRYNHAAVANTNCLPDSGSPTFPNCSAAVSDVREVAYVNAPTCSNVQTSKTITQGESVDKVNVARPMRSDVQTPLAFSQRHSASVGILPLQSRQNPADCDREITVTISNNRAAYGDKREYICHQNRTPVNNVPQSVSNSFGPYCDPMMDTDLRVFVNRQEPTENLGERRGHDSACVGPSWKNPRYSDNTADLKISMLEERKSQIIDMPPYYEESVTMPPNYDFGKSDELRMSQCSRFSKGELPWGMSSLLMLIKRNKILGKLECMIKSPSNYIIDPNVCLLKSAASNESSLKSRRGKRENPVSHRTEAFHKSDESRHERRREPESESSRKRKSKHSSHHHRKRARASRSSSKERKHRTLHKITKRTSPDRKPELEPAEMMPKSVEPHAVPRKTSEPKKDIYSDDTDNLSESAGSLIIDEDAFTIDLCEASLEGDNEQNKKNSNQTRCEPNKRSSKETGDANKKCDKLEENSDLEEGEITDDD